MFEAVVEDLEVKRQLFAKVAAAVKRHGDRHQQHLGPRHRGHDGAPARPSSAGASWAPTSSTRRAT